MSYSSDRLGFILPGMPWLSNVEAKGRIVPRKWKARQQAAQNINPAASDHDSVAAGIREPLKKIPGKRSRGGIIPSLDLFSLRSCHSEKVIMDLTNSGYVSSNRLRQLPRLVGRNVAT